MPSPVLCEHSETSDLSTSDDHSRNEEQQTRNLDCMETGKQQ